MRKRKWIAIVVLAPAIVACLPLPNLLLAARMAWALRSLASGSTGEQLPVGLTKVRRHMGNRSLEALVYNPKDAAPTRALVFVAGISELGCYHPRLMALCRYLANEGFLVLTPDVPEFRRFEVSAEPVDQIVFWFRQLKALEGTDRLKHVGLAGISFSATLSLIAAAKPEIRNQVDFLLGIGSYWDLRRCAEGWFASGPVTVGEDYYPTRFYAKWIIMNAALGMLPEARDREFLHQVLLDLLLQKKVPPADPGLTPAGLRWYKLALLRENQSDDELSTQIREYLEPIIFRQLDPEQAAAEIRCPVFLVHGAYDDLIPPEESREMQAHITGPSCYLLTSPFLTHTHPLDRSHTWGQRASSAVESLAFFYRFARHVR